MATCTISQYDFRTGTSGVICGSRAELPCAKPIMITATINPAAGIKAFEFLYNNSPAVIPTHEMKIIASYPLLHGACPEIYHLATSPRKWKKYPTAPITIIALMVLFKTLFGLNNSTNPSSKEVRR